MIQSACVCFDPRRGRLLVPCLAGSIEERHRAGRVPVLSYISTAQSMTTGVQTIPINPRSDSSHWVSLPAALFYLRSWVRGGLKYDRTSRGPNRSARVRWIWPRNGVSMPGRKKP